MERNVICNWDTSFEELDFKVEILLKIRCAIYVFHFVYFSYYIQTLFQKGAGRLKVSTSRYGHLHDQCKVDGLVQELLFLVLNQA